MNYILYVTLTVLIVGFTSFHLWMISNNKSTIEFIEKKKDGLIGKYDIGCKNNFEQVLGTGFWFCPTNPEYESDGTFFKEKILKVQIGGQQFLG